MLLLKRLVQTFLLLFVFLIIYLNLKLYHTPVCENGINQDVVKQLSFLENELKSNQAAERMQKVFPEGYLFSNVLYGLAWADILANADKNSVLFKKGRTEIRFSIDQINSLEGKIIFNETLDLPYGAFYKGWSSYLMGKYLKLLDSPQQDTAIHNLFVSNCLAIEESILKTDKPYLESYLNLAWPADNIMCLASLNLHDEIYPPQYKALKNEWMSRIKAHLDNKTGLIPHAYSLYNNTGADGVRGSSQSLMHCFLPALDSSFAQDQFQKYKKDFLDYKLTLPNFREYSKGFQGSGDIDSGPIIWDVGPVASIVGIKAMVENKDWTFCKPIRNCIETLGFPISFGEKKRYLFGQLFIADAFIAWSNAKACEVLQDDAGWWRWKFHLISLIVLVPFCWWVYRL
jgi:hypothetical protein